MADVEHSALTGSDLHEPKGAASAAANQLYVADGAASGAWTTVNNTNQIILNLVIADIDTDHGYVVSPLAGSVTKIYTVIDGTIATADATLTPSIGGVALTNGVVTITASGSSGGNVDSSTPTANNTVAAGQAIVFANGLEATNVVAVTITIIVDVA